MNHPISRTLVAHAVIGLGIVVGAHVMVVEPAVKRLAQARVKLSQREAAEAQLRTVQAALPGIEAATDLARREARAIDAGGAPARDPGTLFATLAALAARHNVRVDQLDPFEPPSLDAPQPSTEPDAPPPPRDYRLGYTMTLVAPYADLAGFLRSIQTDLGHARIVSVRINPERTGTQVHARIQTIHYAFDLGPAAAAAGTANGGCPLTVANPRAQVIQGTALIAPALIILGLGTLAGGPASAPGMQAAAPAIDPAIVPAPPRPLNSAQQRCVTWLASLPPIAPSATPMVMDAPPEPEEPQPIMTVELPPNDPGPAAPPPPPDLKLTAMLGSTAGGIAVIDGRILAVGQSVAATWRLTLVDAASDLIEITCDDGRVEQIRLRRDHLPQ